MDDAKCAQGFVASTALKPTTYQRMCSHHDSHSYKFAVIMLTCYRPPSRRRHGLVTTSTGTKTKL